MSRYPYTDAYDHMRMVVGDDYGKGLISRAACSAITHLVAECTELTVEQIATAVAAKAIAAQGAATMNYRSCTPEEELELSRVVERDLRERIRELESALAELAEWARDIAGDCDDPAKSEQEDEMIERIYRVLEESK